MFKGIVAFTIEQTSEGIKLNKAYAGRCEGLVFTDFETACGFITQDMGQAFYVVWQLDKFSDVLFSLLNKSTREDLGKQTRIIVGNVKIFCVPQMLGLTYTKPEHANFVIKKEVNIYGLEPFLTDWDTPASVLHVCEYGEKLLRGLEAMGLKPTKLTSPVGVFVEGRMHGLKLPTIDNCPEELIPAMEYAENAMGYEWRECYQVGFWDKAYVYDRVSAYPAEMALLRNTSKATVVHSESVERCHWGIVKGKIEITADVCPLDANAQYFSTEEIAWLYRNKAGTFKMADGYFLHWEDSLKPYDAIIRQVFGYRQNQDAVITMQGKRIGQGLSGKLDQSNRDGELGEFYNPILALITRSRCRLNVADFIYRNQLKDFVITVIVDGMLASSKVEIGPNWQLGSWKVPEETPALVLGKGMSWRPGKRPQGIGYADILSAFEAQPQKSRYTVGDKVIDLRMCEAEASRKFEHYPRTGWEVLSQKNRGDLVRV